MCFLDLELNESSLESKYIERGSHEYSCLQYFFGQKPSISESTMMSPKMSLVAKCQISSDYLEVPK